MTKRKITLDDIGTAVGTIVGTSDWRVISQAMIDKFADATHDRQWIHCDAEQAKAKAPFGATIAHGFLTLSMLSTLAYEALPALEGATMDINYGFDNIRFKAPVRSGAKIRAIFKLVDADIRPSGRILSTYDVTLEVEGSLQPALTATWLTLAVVEQA